MTYSVPKAQPARKFRTARTVTALILREISTAYGRTAIGYLWAFIEPVAGILLMTVVFSIVASTPQVGTSFAMFFASGLLPFMAYIDISNKIASSLRFSQALLFYPGVTFVDAIIARLILNGLTETLVMFSLFAAIILLEGLDLILDIPALLLGVAMTLSLSLGIGTLNCFLLSIFPVWERAWAILNRPLFIISGIAFTFSSVPQPFRDWLWYNPIVHLIGQIRAGVYPTYDASYVSPLFVFSVSAITLLAGLILLGRYKSYILNDG